jgi:predicted DsbA family dithiol-disulfide isomerase
VPFVVLDDRLGVSGAQPVDVFERALLAALGEAPVDGIAGAAR